MIRLGLPSLKQQNQTSINQNFTFFVKNRRAFWCMSGNPECMRDFQMEPTFSMKPSIFFMKFAQYFKNLNKNCLMSHFNVDLLGIPIVDIWRKKLKLFEKISNKFSRYFENTKFYITKIHCIFVYHWNYWMNAHVQFAWRGSLINHSTSIPAEKNAIPHSDCYQRKAMTPTIY